MSTPLLLEYGGARPVFTVKPCRRALYLRQIDDESPLIEPVNARGGAFLDFHRPYSDEGSDSVPAAYRFAPVVEICTAPERAWRKGREEEYTTRFYVRYRCNFAAAYRAARMIAAGRPVLKAVNVDGWEVGLYVEVAPAHRRLFSAELAEHLCVAFDEQSGCRVCGCTDANACQGGCDWDQPDLCSACVGREPHGPCEGFTGECDWCGKRSRRLLLTSTVPEFGWRIEMASCPRCRKADGKEGY